MRPPPCAVAWLALRAPPRRRESRRKGRKLLKSFRGARSAEGKVFWKFRTALTRIVRRGCNGVARGRGLHVSWELQWGSLSTVARRREGSPTDPKRVGSVVSASEGSPRCSPHGHLRVGRWAGEAEECRGSKGRHAPWSEIRWVREGKRRHGSLHAAASGRRRNAYERGAAGRHKSD